MRSAPQDDTTTRARIRDAAIGLFGRDGYSATSVRAVAEAAGVSAALVIHHFGSKEGLRTACDDHVLAQLSGERDVFDQAGLATTLQNWLADTESYSGSLDYLSRTLFDGTAMGDRLFEEFVTTTEQLLADGVANGSMTRSSDPRTRAVLIAIQGLSTLVFQRQIGRALGEPGLTAAALRRMTIPSLELYTHGLYADASILEATTAALAASAPDSAAPDRASAPTATGEGNEQT